MMGRLTHDQEQFFYSFRLDEAVPDDHPVREIAAVLDLSWVHSELAPLHAMNQAVMEDRVQLMLSRAAVRFINCAPPLKRRVFNRTGEE